MIKLYNYDKETLKFKRVLELEKMPDNYEFCSLVKIPKYNEETEYLEYDKQKDNWIVKEIEKPVFYIEFEKSNIKKQIQAECEKLILEKYPIYRQNNIGIFGNDEERQDFKEYKEFITSQFYSFNSQVDKLKTEKSIKEYSFQFKIKGE